MCIQYKVAEFKQATGGDSRSYAEIIDLRKRLLREELAELIEALESGDPLRIAQEAADLVYVTYGTTLSVDMGIDLDAAVAEVHRANMSKVGSDGTFLVRSDGKVLKGPKFTPPDMRVAVA